jgi:hypothetical protein
MTLPQVTTQSASNIGGASATLSGSIVSLGDPAYEERGFVYGTAHNPTVEDNTKKPVSGRGLGDFGANITGLTTGTTYYARAYAINSEGIAYSSNEVSFTPSYPNIVKVGNLLVPKNDASTGCSWGEAQTMSNNYSIDGVSGWHLPSTSELLSIRSALSGTGLTFSGEYWTPEYQEVKGSWCGTNIYNYDYTVKLYYVNMSNGSTSYINYSVGCTTGSAVEAARNASTTRLKVRLVCSAF